MRTFKISLFCLATPLLLTACGGNQKVDLGTIPGDVSKDVPLPPFPYEEAKTLLFSNPLADFTCSVNLDKATELKCWGDNSNSQVSGDAKISSAAPMKAISNLPQEDIVNVIIGQNHVCSVYLDNSLWCWGDNTLGQISPTLPKKNALSVSKLNTAGVFDAGDIRTVAAGDAHTCVVVNNMQQSIWCWGDNSYGQVSGDGTTDEVEFVNVTKTVGLPNDSVNALAAGEQFTCASYSAEGIWCWGRNDHNQITGEPNNDMILNPETTPLMMPIYKIDGLPREGLLELKSGSDHMCASYDNGSIWCWGNDANAQVSAIKKTTTLSPGLTIVPNLSTNVLSLTAGQNFTCANFTDGNLSCWGRNEYGTINAIGKEGSAAERLSLVNVVQQSVFLSAGANHVCASFLDGTISCWGKDTHGQVSGTGEKGKKIQAKKNVALDGKKPADKPDAPDIPDVPDVPDTP